MTLLVDHRFPSDQFLSCSIEFKHLQEKLFQCRLKNYSESLLRVAILIFIVKQAVPVTFIDFLQALTLQIHLEIVKSVVEMYSSRAMCDNSFSHMSMTVPPS